MKLQEGSILKGIGVGLLAAVGEVLVINKNPPLPAWSKSTATQGQELTDLKNAIAAVSAELDELAAQAEGSSSDIFHALRFLIADRELFDAASQNIAAGWSAAAAFGKAVDEFAGLIGGDSIADERVADLQDLSLRVQAKIAGIELGISIPETGRIVLVAEDLSPADTAWFTDAVVGIVTTKGGPTSHTAIICRSRSIAAIVNCSDALSLSTGETVVVDPVGDRVIVTEDISQATGAIDFVAVNQSPLVPVQATIGSLQDALNASRSGATGVGLFRTELLYLGAETEPGLTEQAIIYEQIFEAAPAGPIVVRTIDAAGDKSVPFLGLTGNQQQPNQVAGYTLLTENRGFIESQLNALEAARGESGRQVWVMAPMISTLEQARDFAELARSIGSYRVGITVETPSISTVVDQLAGIVDFVSIGTNDLSRYLFDVDRMNPDSGELLNHWQPELITKISEIARLAKKAGLDCAVCGESASDPAFAVVLAGLGIDSVSVSISSLSHVKNALSSLSKPKAEEIAAAVLSQPTADLAKATAYEMLNRK